MTGRPIAAGLLLGLALLSLAGCAAEIGAAPGAYSGTVVLEGRHVYAAGAALPGTLLLVDGEVVVEPGAAIDGSVWQVGGALILGGTLTGDLSAVGGRVELAPGAVVGGSVRVGSATLRRSPEAAVGGEVLAGPASGLTMADLFPERTLGERLLWVVPEALVVAALAYAAVRFAPRAVGRVRRAATRHPAVSAAMGLLAAVVGAVLLVVMAFTLILIPVTFLGLVAGFLAIGYGWIGLGVAAGQRLAAWRGRAPEPRRLAFLGTLLFMVALNLVALIPLVGDLVELIVAAVGLGAVVLTRFGLREFVPEPLG